MNVSGSSRISRDCSPIAGCSIDDRVGQDEAGVPAAERLESDGRPAFLDRERAPDDDRIDPAVEDARSRRGHGFGEGPRAPVHDRKLVGVELDGEAAEAESEEDGRQMLDGLDAERVPDEGRAVAGFDRAG